MRMRTDNHTITGAFSFLLLGIFAVAATITVLMGVRFYRLQTEQAALHNDQRILTSYVRSMMRPQDETGVIGTDEIDGIPMLTYAEEYDGIRYVTRIYAYDGYLREWFSEEAYEFRPGTGEELFPAQEFQAQIADGLVQISIRNEQDEPVTVQFALRSQDGAERSGP